MSANLSICQFVKWLIQCKGFWKINNIALSCAHLLHPHISSKIGQTNSLYANIDFIFQNLNPSHPSQCLSYPVIQLPQLSVFAAGPIVELRQNIRFTARTKLISITAKIWSSQIWIFFWGYSANNQNGEYHQQIHCTIWLSIAHIRDSKIWEKPTPSFCSIWIQIW